MWGTELMQQMPRIAGNADPIHYSQMLPGVQTNNEYRGGVNVQGCDNAHTVLSIGGVPIYNATHLFGIFSTFNSSHYPTLTLDKGVDNAAHPERLGARLDMQLPTLLPAAEQDSALAVTGEVECGLISSQGTLRVNCNKNTQLTLSGRGSYINLLYGSMLEVDGSSVRYTFGDANMTLNHRRGRNTFVLDSYFGMDNAIVGDDTGASDIHCRWGNNMQALHWEHEGPLHTSTVLSHSSYNNNLRAKLASDDMQLPSSIDDYTLSSDLTWRRWHAGAQATCYSIRDQHAEISSPYLTEKTAFKPHQSGLFALYADYTLPLLNDYTSLNIGVRPSLFVSHDHKTYKAADPHVSFKWKAGAFDGSLGWAMRHQYLFFDGITDIGLPIEFWMGTSSAIKPQWAQGLTLNSGVWLPGRKWRIDVDAFYKRMYRQQEYVGTLLDLLDSQYKPQNMLRESRGYNYGGSFMLSRHSGPLTGWLAYSYTRATRKSDLIATTTGTFPTSHERPHEFNAVASYAFKKHWVLSTTAVVASGTPFTASRNFYLLAGNILTQYGEHNANRLPTYYRIDFAATYKWHEKHRVQHALNLSVYNVTAHTNVLFYSLRVFVNSLTYYYKPSSFITSVLPSISYSIRF